MSRSRDSTATAASASAMKMPSVISITSRGGVEPVALQRRRHDGGHVRLGGNWVGDTFTATRHGSGQAAADAQALSITHRPIGVMRSAPSASGMNSAGGTVPRWGWFQRISASKVSISPEAALRMGW